MKPAPKPSVAISSRIFAQFDAILDVRSPAEYAEDHIPRAVSCPVLDNEERAKIGILYKQTSSFEAKRAGSALVAKNIAHLVETVFAHKSPAWKPLVYCWRGGKRSAAMAHVLREIGWDARTLEGGYKSYRKHVVETLSELPQRFRFRVVHGVTGSGKSRVLRAMKKAGAQTLDLEELAAHRGSVLGNLPERPQPSQKMFESLLLRELSLLDAGKPVHVEGESRKIGQLQVPTALIEAMRASECVVLEAGLETRVALLMDEYQHFFGNLAALGTQLDCLVELHGRDRIAEWKGLAERGEWRALVARLLEEHYDPAYKRSAARNFARLPDAPVLKVPAADDAAFARLAEAAA